MEIINIDIQYIDKHSKKQFNNYTELLEDLYYNLGTITNKYSIDKISTNTDIIPMYDIYTENIFLVSIEQLYDRLVNYHYRPLNSKIIEIINKTGKNKLINFVKNFNIQLLIDTFYKNIYNNNPTTDEITECTRPSFMPIFNSNPYYTKTELIYLALNNNLWHENLNLNDICDQITNNDISANSLLEHQIYIKENAADNYIKFYSFLGSTPFNNYLRFPENNNRDTILEKHIFNFRSILVNSPPWKKEYYFYRWINNDDFLKKYSIGDIWEDYGFLSTTRQPFVDPDKNYFGYILVKIKVPKNSIGCGLAIEYYSHFLDEQEIVFPPSKYKLINTENTKYYHPNPIVANKVISKYEFEWTGHIDEYIRTDKLKETKMINTLDINTNLNGYNVEEKLSDFYLKYSNKFYSTIGNEKLLFNVNKIEAGAYDDFFYINKLEKYDKFNTTGKELFITLQNENNGEINLFIEIGSIISVNYYFRFNPNEIKIIGKYEYADILYFLKKISELFSIEQVLIHSDYKKYETVLNKKYDSSYLQKIIINNESLSYHDKQMYISDCFYFNQILYHYICNIYMIDSNSSEFTNFVYNYENVKITYNIDIITYLMSIELTDFLYQFDTNDTFIQNQYIDLIFKLARKIMKNTDTVINKLNNIIKAKRKIISGKKLIDLYFYIFTNYYYLIPYLHSIIFNNYNIDLDNLIFSITFQVEHKNISIPINDINKLRLQKDVYLKRMSIKTKKYKLLYN
jgi:hypothetical protein